MLNQIVYLRHLWKQDYYQWIFILRSVYCLYRETILSADYSITSENIYSHIATFATSNAVGIKYAPALLRRNTGIDGALTSRRDDQGASWKEDPTTNIIHSSNIRQQITLWSL
jgi:hypothetical protein